MMEQKICKLDEKILIEKKFIGNDYQMTDGEWTNRYKTLDYARGSLTKTNEYTISESDKIKGTRLAIIDKNTGEIIWPKDEIQNF